MMPFVRSVFASPRIREQYRATRPLSELRQRLRTAAAETHPAPSEAQRQAGNYPKGLFRFRGLEVSIENPAGSVRSGKSKTGKKWAVAMPFAYGCLRRTLARDGDQVDVFLGPHLDSDVVFGVDQVDPRSGRYDETKWFLGWKSKDAARQAYADSYSPGWQGFLAITAMTFEQFKRWLEHGEQTKPIHTQVTERYAAGPRTLWNEKDHPREADGEFADKGQADGGEKKDGPEKRPAVPVGAPQPARREGKGKEARIVLQNGEAAPAHITPAMIPPAWKNVQVYTDPGSEIWVRATMPGKNGKKDAPKAVYKPSYEAQMAQAKFTRKNVMQAQIGEIDSKIEQDRANPRTKDAADVAFLMREQATRPGSEKDTKGMAKNYGRPITAADVVVTPPKNGKGPSKVALKVGAETIPIKDQGMADEIQRRIRAGESLEDSTFWLKSHGATTLEGRHVVEADDGVRLRFAGKEGVWHDHLVANPELAKMLVARKANAGDRGKLFGVSDTKAAAYIKTLDHGRLTPKDLRTNRADEIAAEEVAKFSAPPKDADEAEERKKAVALTVSKKLGNRPEMCIEKYIDPSIWLHPAFGGAA